MHAPRFLARHAARAAGPGLEVESVRPGLGFGDLGFRVWGLGFRV